jgi:hypothetical protein
MASSAQSDQSPYKPFWVPKTRLFCRPSSAFVVFVLASQMASSAHASADCFSEKTNEQAYDLLSDSKDGNAGQYMLGMDRLLEPVTVRFFSDGRVCGANPYLDIRFEGSNKTEGDLDIKFLAAPVPPADTPKESQEQTKYIFALFRDSPSGNARKELTTDLILWSGSVTDNSGKKHDFYIKRPRPGAHIAVANNTANRGYSCGESGCDPLTFYVSIKAGSVQQFLEDVKRLPVAKVKKVELSKDETCPYVESREGDVCYTGTTWPFEEHSVVSQLSKKSYVRNASRSGGEAGSDTDNFFLKSDYLLSQDHRLNVPVAAALFQTAITEYFNGTGLPVSDPIARNNSLFWEFKGRRFQFEKNPHPSPSDKSEWWKFRLQVGVTEGDPGIFIFIMTLPETRIASWALDTIPNDEKFTTELDNDQRFLDLQGRLEVALTKYVAAAKE